MTNNQETTNLPTEEDWKEFEAYEAMINNKADKTRKGEINGKRNELL